MDFFTYWNNWRKAYHGARIVYHQEMARFYESQIQTMEIWPKMMLEAYKAMIGAFVIKNLGAFKNPMDFSKWA